VVLCFSNYLRIKTGKHVTASPGENVHVVQRSAMDLPNLSTVLGREVCYYFYCDRSTEGLDLFKVRKTTNAAFQKSVPQNLNMVFHFAFNQHQFTSKTIFR